MEQLRSVQSAQKQYQESQSTNQWDYNYAPVYDEYRPFLKFLNILIKRTADIVLSALLLVILAIPLVVIYLLIRIDSPGPVLFTHERIGRKGRPFQCYKFRTMHHGAVEKLSSLLESDQGVQKEWEKHRKLENDPRITGLGLFLRSTSLDELPQLFNVVKGEMSLVGPRPVPQEEIEKYYRNDALVCFSVTPGITGLWQVSGRNRISYKSRISLDIWYARNWNLWIDTVILGKTVWTVLKREGV